MNFIEEDKTLIKSLRELNGSAAYQWVLLLQFMQTSFQLMNKYGIYYSYDNDSEGRLKFIGHMVQDDYMVTKNYQ